LKPATNPHVNNQNAFSNKIACGMFGPIGAVAVAHVVVGNTNVIVTSKKHQLVEVFYVNH